MLRNIHLHGTLAKKYGSLHYFDVDSPAMAISALKSQIKGLAQDIKEGKFILIRGDYKTGMQVGLNDLALKLGQEKNIHLVPAIEGSGGRTGGIIKIVLGIALLAVGIGGAIAAAGAGAFGATAFGFAGLSVTWGGIAITGLAVTLAGISALLTPRLDLTPQGYEARESADDRPSFLMNVPKNRSEQGAPVPLVFGRMRTGSVVVSTGLSVEAI